MTQPPTALITGASSGIGLAIALHFADLGYQLVIGGKEPANEMQGTLAELKLAGAASVHYDPADMRDGMAVRAMIARAHARAHAHDKLGGLDILINNAGIQHIAPIERFAPDAWQAVIDVNLSASFHSIAAAIPLMRKANYGRIINIASVHGLVASAHKAAYVAAKHGLIGLTKAVALELADTSITCNAICPGFVRTPLISAQIKERARNSGRSIEDEAKALVSAKQPNGQFILPEQIAEMAAYLASAGASGITGAQFTIDGGWTAQ